MSLWSGCDLVEYEEEDQWGERDSEPGKGRREDSIWMIGSEVVVDIVGETKQLAWEEQGVDLKRGWTWPREGKR